MLIYLHISNRPEIPLKLFLDTLDTFFEKNGNYYLPFECVYNGFRFIDNNSEKYKMEKVNR